MDKEDMVCAHTHSLSLLSGILLSHKEEWHNAIFSNMEGPRDYQTKWLKSGKDRQISYDITYTWNLNYDSMNLSTQQKQNNRVWTCGCQGGVG